MNGSSSIIDQHNSPNTNNSTRIRKAFEGATRQDAGRFQRTKDEDVSSIKLYFVPSKWMSKLLQYIQLVQYEQQQHVNDGTDTRDRDRMDPMLDATVSVPVPVEVGPSPSDADGHVEDGTRRTQLQSQTANASSISTANDCVPPVAPLLPPIPPDRIENVHYLRRHATFPSSAGSSASSNDNNVNDESSSGSNSDGFIPITAPRQGSSSPSNASDHSAESARARRAARREKWKKKEQQQEQKKSSQAASSLSSKSNFNSSSRSISIDKMLRKGLKYGKDYVLVGEGLWTLLSSKFGYDVDIDFIVSAVDDPDMGDIPGGSSDNGDVAATRRVVQVYQHDQFSGWVDLPSDGVFDYPTLVQEHVMMNVELITDDDTGNGHCSGSGSGIGSGISDNNSDTTDNDAAAVASSIKDDDELFPLEEPTDDDNDESSPPILLLPPSTTQPSACRSLYIPDSSDMILDSDPAKSDDGKSNDSSSSTNKQQLPNPRKRKRYGSGLGNLGNTCFMNSTLQCLAHTGPLRSYFLSGEYASDLNRDNPLGTGGELATEFANLLSEMWGTDSSSAAGGGSSSSSALRNSSMYGYRRSWNNSAAHSNSSSVVYPRNFKYTLGKHAEQFMGYNQHDSQELATYLLDALHEDTNRVSKKPYVEKPEQGEDECDEDAADKAWELHLKREDSRVLESFMGQVKSRVECPRENCGRVSTTFDPTMYLSIPLPGATERTIEVTFVPMASDQVNKKFHVTVSKNATIKDLQKKTTNLIQESMSFAEDIESTAKAPAGIEIDAKNLVIGEVFQQDIYMFYSATDEISRIRESDDIYAFQVASVESIHNEQDVAKEETQAQSPSPVVDGDSTRPNVRRLKLDLPTITRLNDDWENVFATYLSQSTTLPTLLNSRRHTHEDRMAFHQKVNNFIKRCYASPECTNKSTSMVSASSSTSSQSDIELQLFDESDSENDGKSSPTTHVANRLGATVVDDNAQTLEELCQTFSSFKNVRTPEDVATLEFCNKKFYQYSMNEVNEKKRKYRDGAEIQVTFRTPNSIGSSDRKCGLPFVLRISPTLTVYGLRKMLASRLAPCLAMTSTSTKAQQQSSGDSAKETKDEPMTHDDPHRNGDFLFHDGCAEEFRILRKIPLTYERKNAPNSYSMKPSSYRKLGSIVNSDKSSFSHHSSVSFAMPDEEAENETVLEIVGQNGKVNIHWPSKDLFDEEKWTYHECEGTHHKEGKTKKEINVLDCIRKYCQIEQLEETEMWYCNKCKEHVRAWKQFHLYRTPPILIVHLKRFHYSSLTHRRDKIDLFVDFPLKGLDLTQEVMYWDKGEEPIYDCYAVSNHFGGLGGGHYTAYAVNDEGEWCNFDDSRVSTNVDEAEVVSSAAYVLYYRRRDVKVDDQVWAERPLPSLSTKDSNPSKQMDVEGSSTDGLLTSSTPTCSSPIGSLGDMCDEEMVDTVDTVFDSVDI